MSIPTEQAIECLLFTDYAGNYYLVPTETFAQGRVPAERKAEIEQALHEHDVTGYNPLLVGMAVGFGAGAVASLAVVTAGVAVGAAGAYAYSQLSSGSKSCFEPRPTTVYT